MEKDFIVQRDGNITTSSRMRVWWLTTFQGYEVRRVSAQPQKNPFGKVQLVNHWELRAAPDDTIRE